MKESSQRRDPASKSDGQTDHQALQAERDAEAKVDARLGAGTEGDERTDLGRNGAELAGGNGEQRSRERARIESEKDPTGKQPPFPKRPEAPDTKAARSGAEAAIEADQRNTVPRTPRGLAAERTDAPMSQSGARITDFE